MARSQSIDYLIKKQGDYRQTDTYRSGNAATRKDLNRYYRELELDPQQMYLIVRKRELAAVSDEAKKEAALPGQMLLLVVALGFAASMGAANSLSAITIFSEIALVIAVIVVYFMGLFDRYRIACRRVDHMLKSYPTAPDYDAWIAEHPKSAASASQQRSSKKSHKKGKKRK